MTPAAGPARRFVRAGARPLRLVAALSLLLFGVLGVGRPDPAINGDWHYLLAAGNALWTGANPYDFDALVAATPDPLGIDFALIGYGFAYPPHVATLAVPFAWMGRAAGSVTMLGLNLAALGALLAAIRRLRPSDDPHDLALLDALWLLSPLTAHALWIGQTTLLAGAAVFLALAARRPGREDSWTGALWVLALAKPQVALLGVVWLALERRHATLAVIVGLGLALSAPLLAVATPVELVTTFLDALSRYQAGRYNALGAPWVVSLDSAIAALGVSPPPVWPLAVAALAAVHRIRDRIADDEAHAALIAASCLTLYAHDYDLALAAPFWYALWRRLDGRPVAEGALIIAVAVVWLPKRLILGLPAGGALVHLREISLLATWIAWFAGVATSGSRFSSPPVSDPSKKCSPPR